MDQLDIMLNDSFAAMISILSAVVSFCLWLIVPFLGLCLVYLVFATLVVLWRVKMWVEPILEPVDLAQRAGKDLPKFEEITRELNELGFSPTGDFILQSSEISQSLVRTFVNKEKTIKGCLFQAATQPATGKQFALAFSSEFSDGGRLETLNNPQAEIFKYPAHFWIVRYPLCPPKELYRLHVEKLQELSAGKTVKSWEGDAQTAFIDDYSKVYSWQEEQGILRKDAQGKYYRFTLPGAWQAVVKLSLGELGLGKKGRKAQKFTPDKTFRTKYDRLKLSRDGFLCAAMVLMISLLSRKPLLAKENLVTWILLFVSLGGALLLHMIGKKKRYNSQSCPASPVGADALGNKPGTPWQRRKEIGFLKALFKTMAGVLFRPHVFFDELNVQGSLGGSLFFVALMFVVGNTAAFILYKSLFTIRALHLSMAWQIISMPLIIMTVFTVLALIIFPAAMQIGVLLFKGAGGYRGTLHVFFYSMAVFVFLAFLFLGNLPIAPILIFWGVVISFIGFKTVHKFNMLKALIAYASPFYPVIAIILYGVIQHPQILKPQWEIWEESTADTVGRFAVGIEQYAADHNGVYPTSEEELLKANPPYIEMRYHTQSRNGYRYFLELDTSGYRITANPNVCGKSGRTVFVTETGGQVKDIDCRE